MGTRDSRHGKCTGKLADAQTQALCERVFRASSLLGCRAEGLGWLCSRVLAERRSTELSWALPAAQPCRMCAGLQSKHGCKRSFGSRTQISLRAGSVSSVVLMLLSLSLNFSLFSSKYVLSHLFACLFRAGNTSPLDTLAFHPL